MSALEKHYSIAQIVAQGIPESWVRAAIASRALKATRNSARGRYRISESALQAWLDARSSEPSPTTSGVRQARGRRSITPSPPPAPPRRDRESVLAVCPPGFQARF